MRQVLLRRASIVALVAWVVTAVGPSLIPHGDILDLVCSDEAWASPHPTTQIEAVHKSVGDVHCVVCHLQRAVREASAERVGAALDTRQTTDALATADRVVRNHRAGRIPARAPPSLSL